jgi:hypothetical protein|tara:strand:+ start:853 stop:1104 length:252 start_codon:yes stop_codon:yes gene_type:complete
MVKTFEDRGEAMTADMGIIFVAAFFALVSSVAMLVELLPNTCKLGAGRVDVQKASLPPLHTEKVQAGAEWARIQAAACIMETA